MSETMPEPTLPWVKPTLHRTPYTITRVVTQPGKFGKKEVLLILNDKEQVSIWGSNYVYLYNVFGANVSNWLNKPITIHKNEAGHRVVEVPA